MLLNLLILISMGILPPFAESLNCYKCKYVPTQRDQGCEDGRGIPQSKIITCPPIPTSSSVRVDQMACGIWKYKVGNSDHTERDCWPITIEIPPPPAKQNAREDGILHEKTFTHGDFTVNDIQGNTKQTFTNNRFHLCNAPDLCNNENI